MRPSFDSEDGGFWGCGYDLDLGFFSVVLMAYDVEVAQDCYVFNYCLMRIQGRYCTAFI